MTKKNDFLRLESGHILNFSNKSKELKESDFRTPEGKKLFNIFSGGDGVLDKKDYKNIWQMAGKYANKNNNAELFDEDEKQAMLDEINKNSGEKFDRAALTDFLMKVFQKPDKVELEDTAQLNVPFHEMREGSIQQNKAVEKRNQSKNEFAENIFNPNKKDTVDEYYDDGKIKSKTITDEAGNLVRAIYYDKTGKPQRVEIKTESGWEITDFEPDWGEYSIIKTGTDKNIKQSEVGMVGNKIAVKIEYDTTDNKNRTAYFYRSSDDKHSLLYVTEYKDNKIVKDVNYNETGQEEQSLEYIYDNKFHNGQRLSQLRTYNARGELIKLVDNIAGKEYDGAGNVIEPVQDYEEQKRIEQDEFIYKLLDNLTTEKISNINRESVLDMLNRYAALSIKFDQNGNEYGRRNLIDDILSNQNATEKKEQLKIIVEALREKIEPLVGNNARVSDKMMKEGKQKLNAMLDECLSDNIDNSKIKSNIEKVIKLFDKDGRYYEFGGLAHNDIPNGKIDKISYQNNLGDCWLLSSMDAMSELECGQEYLSQFIENDKDNKQVKVKLDGGKVEYTFSYEDIQNAYSMSIGDADMKALEMAYDRYFKEVGYDGSNTIDGGWQKNAFAVLSGNKPVDATIQNGKAGVLINGEFVEISKKNRKKLKHIPIDMKNITPEILAQIKEIQDFTAKTVVSSNGTEHAYYLTDISGAGHITTKEPNSPNLARTYTQEYFLQVYKDMTIFIM